MFLSRLIWVLCISTCVFLTLPAANLLLRAQVGDVPRWPETVRGLWSVGDLEGLAALHLWRCCTLSLDPHRVIAGQSGQLFLGNYYENVLDRSIGAQRQPAAVVQDWTRHVVDIRDWLSDRGVPFVFVIAPNKHTIYADALPDHFDRGPTTDTDSFVATAQELALPVLDTRPLLLTLKQTAHAYRFTDSHWTNLGAATAYQATLERLAQDGARFAPVPFQARLEPQSAGDLARVMRAQPFLPADVDVDYTLTLPKIPTCHARFLPTSNPPDPCDASADAAVTPNMIDVFHTAGAPNRATALLLCDSFCGAQLDLYTQTFTTVYHAPWGFIDDTSLEALFERLAPDMVVYQLVERNLLYVRLGLR